MIRLDEILDKVRGYAPDADLGLVRKAWVYAQKHHAGQTRQSGEPYFAHPLEVANLLADLRMDTDTLAAAILHDTVEDTDATLEDIAEKFNTEISEMVDGVTKLNKLNNRTAQEAKAENFRKLVLAMSRDIRVIVIKLADRLHNMQTLKAMRPDKRIRIAQETMDLYAPIANRLGIVSIKGQLQDLAFAYLHPDVHAELERQVEARRPWFEAYIERVKEQLVAELAPSYPNARVSGRVKRLWSIWRKMQTKQLTFEEVHDLLAFRVTVQSVMECYGALGLVHGLWTPQSEKFKDYIAQPKANGYQSLHTTIIGPEAQRIEVQIRTEEMHRFGEYGIAAHWTYKEGKLTLKREDIEKYTKVRQLLRWAEDIEDSREFLDVLKVDLYADQVYVYTPRGDVKWFPRGATPLDFAYAIHTEVGHHCAGARINGRLVKLNYPLGSGDTVEVLQKADQHPKKDWLRMAKTSRALSKIRQHLRLEERKQAIEVGKRLLDQELRKYGKNLKSAIKKDALRAPLADFHLQNPVELFQGIGYGRLSVDRILPHYVAADKLAAEAAAEANEIQTTTLSRLFKRLNRRGGSPVKIDGQEGMLTVFAKCCRPLPGDPILGYITVGRGITVHASSCPQALALGKERRVEVEWDNAHKVPHQARIHVVTVDRPMMLAELTQAIGKMNVNITSADIRTTKEDRGLITLDVAVNDAGQLRTMMSHLERLKGVISVDRVRVGGPVA
jgi:GTP pyrophosphokinase